MREYASARVPEVGLPLCPDKEKPHNSCLFGDYDWFKFKFISIKNNKQYHVKDNKQYHNKTKDGGSAT